MKDWQERDESLPRLIRYTASQLLSARSLVYRGGAGEEVRRTFAYFHHSLRRILLRTRGVVLVSTPKSGRTWLRFMLDHLGIHIQYTHANGRLERPSDLRGRLIHLHRDPRDTVTSAWYQYRKRRKRKAGDISLIPHFSDFLRDHGLGLEQRVRFNLFWAQLASESGGFVTSYEKLHEDTEAELRRVVLFITGTAPEDAAIGEAVAEGRFSRMRALEAGGRGSRLYGDALAPGDPTDPESYKTREGKIGMWKAHFSDSDSAFAEDVFQRHDYFDRMRRLAS